MAGISLLAVGVLITRERGGKPIFGPLIMAGVDKPPPTSATSTQGSSTGLEKSAV